MSQERLKPSVDADRLSTLDLVELIQAQDTTVADAVARQAPAIAKAIDVVAERLGRGGRLYYVGAGTSGRIALLDAVELPPTYGVDPDLVQVIVAGGPRALVSSAEGAEDDERDGAEQVEHRGVCATDAVVGIAASGTTPFTVAAVRRARELGAFTIGLTAEPQSPLAEVSELAIVPETGPEVILGSTRMKAGTAQKMVLNTLSTGVMTRLGRIYSNLMVSMPATNEKLRKRARQMVALGSGVALEEASRALDAASGDVRAALIILRLGVSPEEARSLLETHGGRLREVFGE